MGDRIGLILKLEKRPVFLGVVELACPGMSKCKGNGIENLYCDVTVCPRSDKDKQNHNTHRIC